MNKKNQRRWIGPACLTAAVACTTGGIAFTASGTNSSEPAGQDILPSSITLTGVVRDFRPQNDRGHPDFERQPSGGFGHYVGSVADELDDEGKPKFASVGYRVSSQRTDSARRNIMPVTKSYIGAKQGDTTGTVSASTGGSLTNEANFRQWFRDMPGVNMSKTVPIRLVRQGTSNIYSFSDRTDSTYASRGGFFPIDGDLFNDTRSGHNFGFTFELDTTFVYRQGAGQSFTFTGDDDVWVYIDGKLCVDIGGVHGAISQTVELDRLNWLQDGKRYSLKLFFAERHVTQSNVRIDTTINLQNADLPVTSGLAD